MSGFESAVHLFHSGGLVMYPLLILSLITLAIAVERFYYYRINRKGSHVFFHGVYHATMQKDWSTITKLVQEFPSAISRIIESGMENASTETSMKGSFSDRMSMESINFRRYLDYLSAIVTIAPLLGLLGTVTGMIQTFSVLDNGGGAAASQAAAASALRWWCGTCGANLVMRVWPCSAWHGRPNTSRRCTGKLTTRPQPFAACTTRTRRCTHA